MVALRRWLEPSSLGTAALTLSALVAAGAPARAQQCEYEHTYLGNLPKEKEPGWHFQAQGISHDASNWFVTQNPRAVFALDPTEPRPDKCVGFGVYQCNDPRLWRLPLEYHLSEDVDCDDPSEPGVRRPVCRSLSEAARSVWNEGYNHYGDIDHHEHGGHAYVCVPLEGSGNPGSLAFFRADDLSFVARTQGEIPHLGNTAAWCAIDSEGFLYSSGKAEEGRTDIVRQFSVSWDALAAEVPEAVLTEVRAIPLQDRDGNPVVLEKFLQGGSFADDDGVLYLTNGTGDDPCNDCGIHVFELRNPDTGGPCDETEGACVARRVAQSTNGSGAFNFEYHPGWPNDEEPEGLTWWDLSAPEAPPTHHTTSAGKRLDETQLHALLLDNDAKIRNLSEDDDVYIKHYRAEVRCEPRAGIAVAPDVIDFGDVDLGASETQALAISNPGDAELVVQAIGIGAGSQPGFAIASAPATPATLAPAASVPVEVTFTPTTAELVTGSVEIASNDPDAPQVAVDLAGTGVSLADQLRRLLDLFDAGVRNELLTGSGPGSSPEHRRAALRAMLEEALLRFERGDLAEACGQLHAALAHTDGESEPKDLVAGPAAADLAQAIRRVRGHLECPVPTR